MSSSLWNSVPSLYKCLRGEDPIMSWRDLSQLSTRNFFRMYNTNLLDLNLSVLPFPQCGQLLWPAYSTPVQTRRVWSVIGITDTWFMLIFCWRMSKTFHEFSPNPEQPFEVSTIMISILQMRKGDDKLFLILNASSLECQITSPKYHTY